jgi:hypothetical protein
MMRRRLLSAALAAVAVANIDATIHTGSVLFAKVAFGFAIAFVLPLIGGRR